MVLLDEKGGRIHATVKGTLNVRKKICEGMPTRHDYRLSFNLRTDVKSTEDATIPANGFSFVDFDVIERESTDSPYLVDVISLLSCIGDVREHVVSGRKTKMVVLELDDLWGHKLECTLWEQHVDKVQSLLENNDSPQNVVIVQLARIKGFRGKIGITNTKYTTRILFDSSLPEIVEFKNKLSYPIDNSMRLTQLSSQSSYSLENDFLKDTERKSICDIKNCSEITTCITYGTIKSIESKFSVQVRVVGNTDSASFILFDKDCVALLGMGAAEIREQHFKRGADLELYPEELNILNEKSMLFKVNVKKKHLDSLNEPKYQVSRVCNSESIIQSFLKSVMEFNDETLFDNTEDNDVVSQERGRDVESQTCESTGDADVSLSLLSPSPNFLNSVEAKCNSSIDANSELEDNEFSPDILNTFSCSGLPEHKLTLKVNVPVMLLRNIDQSRGLCNGTRLLISRLGSHVVEATVLTGSNIGESVLIPRMTMSPSNHTFPVYFQRRQFPLTVSFAMTINKSQGQSLSHVGIYLPKPVFTHGQLYVALSRVKSKQGLKILILDDNSCVTENTFNIVYKEVFQKLV
ncbi:uncharacterized protein LOC133311822 [Gastrolobium bilobum]|uniref:uncharacterized protein LOC133311822 n=1 Tax=Gastrolobium bilobum TaxID=150636 RepID=UPI002AAFDB4C|nr:uncharacterized protein LOC133311822 [Gastrolobium bilobum]